MSKQKVMEDLNALLSDLELSSGTSSHSRPPGLTHTASLEGHYPYSSPQHNSNHGHNIRVSVGSNHSTSLKGSSRESTPPPTHQDKQPQYSTTVTVKNHQVGSGSPSHHSHTVPKVNAHIGSPRSSARSSNHSGTMSSLSNNLSELDMLLQDLSSAQFMAEVNRRNTVNQHSHTNGSVPVINVHNNGNNGHQEEQVGSERSVDSLLYELEHTIPNEGNVRVVQESGGKSNALTSTSATNATKELDSLMNSLTDFKISNSHSQSHSPAGSHHSTEPPTNKATTAADIEALYAVPNKPKKMGQVSPPQPAAKGNMSPHSRPPQVLPPQHILQHSPQMIPPINQIQQTGGPQGQVQQHYHYQQQQQYSSSTTTTSNQLGQEQPVTSSTQTVNQAAYSADTNGMTSACQSSSHYQSLPLEGGGQSTAMSQDYQQYHGGDMGAPPFPTDGLMGKVEQGHNGSQAINEQTTQAVHQQSVHHQSSQAVQSSSVPNKVPSDNTDGDNLDKMLGTLNTDMSAQGIVMVPKGHCQHCAQPIVGPVITALGSIWHPHHFTCARCNDELGVKNFFEREGKPYCEQDYHMLFSPKCAHCSGPIIDKCVTALNQSWHPEHFVCAECHQPFGEDGFHEKDGKAYCRADYYQLFAPRCGRCQTAIMDNFISALSTHWHPPCFCCMECNAPFNGGNFFEHEGMPYCETHYHALRGSLCAGCSQPITGRCITAMFKKFHPEHFVCAFCLRQLNKGTFKEQAEKPYCHECFNRLFGCLQENIH